jgi:hypothetical protein
MANTLTSPNMGIVVPVNLTDPSPDWGARIQTAFYTVVDQHNHTTGNGVPIPTAALNINADLSFSPAGTAYNATGLRSARLVSQSAPLALGSDVGCVYVSNGELWYNDSSARQVQMTSTGAVKSAPQALSWKSVTTNYTILSTDPYQLFYLQSQTAVTAIALPASSSVAVGRVYYFADIGQNSAVNATTITPNGVDTINGINAAATVTVNGGLSILTTDGAGHWTLNTIATQPLGSGSSTIALTTGSVTPTAAQLAAGVVQFTGTLSGNVTLVLPNAPRYFLLDFSAVVMGAHTIAISSGSATSATMAAANIGSTATLAQITTALTYGGNTVRVKA